MHANAAKPVVGTKRRVPSVLELLTATGDLTEGVDFKAIEGAAQVMTAKRQNQATSKASPVAEAFEAHACELPRPPEHEEKGIKEKVAIQKAAAEKVAEEKPAAEKAVVEASRSPPGDNRKQPDGLTITLEVNGIVVDINCGCKCREEHAAKESHNKPQNGCSPEDNEQPCLPQSRTVIVRG